jgi:hypothetical protein
MYKIPPTIDNLELSHSLMDDQMLSYNDDQTLYFLKNLCDQQLGIKNSVDFIYEKTDDILPSVTCIICTDGQVTVSMGLTKSRIPMSKGDVVIFPSEMQYSADPSENTKVKKVLYSKNVDISSGSQQFIVTSTIIDKYEISINADSQEEAIEKAKIAPISKWTHLDLYPEVNDRKIIRYGKWCNFESRPLT